MSVDEVEQAFNAYVRALAELSAAARRKTIGVSELDKACNSLCGECTEMRVSLEQAHDVYALHKKEGSTEN